MNNEQVVEQGLENAPKRFKLNVAQETKGIKKGELTLIMAGTLRGLYSDFRTSMVLAALQSDRTVILQNVEAKTQFKGLSYDMIWYDEYADFPKIRKNKPDWKCTAMERHSNKGGKSESPNRLLMKLMKRMDKAQA